MLIPDVGWWLLEAHSDWIWKPGPLLLAWYEKGEQRVVLFKCTKTQEIPCAQVDVRENWWLLWNSTPQVDRGHHCLVLWPLRSCQRPAVTSKHCGVFSTDVVLRLESARQHTACVRDTYGHSFHLCLSSSICACSFSDCCIFGPPKEAPGETASWSNEEVRFQCMNGCTYSQGFPLPVKNRGVIRVLENMQSMKCAVCWIMTKLYWTCLH
jgi:hypothetical protein